MALDHEVKTDVEAALGRITAHEPVGRSIETQALVIGEQRYLLKPMSDERRPAAVGGVLDSLASCSPALAPRLLHAVELPGRPHWYGVFEWVEGVTRRQDSPDWPGAWDRALRLLATLREQPPVDEGLPRLAEQWLTRLEAVRWHDALAELLYTRLQQELPRAPLVLAHGDFAPQNLVWAQGRAMLVDWEELGRAPAEFDPGWLLTLSSMGATPSLHPEALRARLIDEGLDDGHLRWFQGLGLLRMAYRSRSLPLPANVAAAMVQRIRREIAAFLST